MGHPAEEQKTKVAGERFGFDVSSVKTRSIGENKATQSLFKEKNVHLKFEYTAPNTPQHNGKVERKFATFYGRVRA
eukprot:scaffold15815_cov96-Cylindrotheca_fusiformis.AAC.1